MTDTPQSSHNRSSIRRLLEPIVLLREGEAATTVMMFLYSFLAMTSYNILKPITRSKFIDGLGADNLPYVQLAAGILIGVIMQGYSKVVGLLPRRWSIPITQAGMAGILVLFWVLFQTNAAWVPVGFYLLGLILGILLISQFWTLANDIFDPRQAKRLFGFIGGGASLGGILGSTILTVFVTRVGTVNLLLVSAFGLVLCLILVGFIVKREGGSVKSVATADEKGVGGQEAIRLLRESPHLQTIALVIAFAAIGAAVIEQQLNLAAQAFKGQNSTDSITAFLGQVQLATSVIGFVIQVWLTSKIHQYLGIGFALLVLPVSLGSSAMVILLNAALWAPALARVLDTALRYTVDKTTREVLFLPLPTDLKYQAKPFVDVTVDRFAKAIGALLTLVLIKPWGLHLSWPQLSYASLTICGLWILMAIRARRGYLLAFRRSIEHRDVEPAEMRISVADLTTVETLVEELSNPDARRVLYAIDILESLDKRNLITPLLLHHESDEVRIRVLSALEGLRPELAERWVPQIERMLKVSNSDVRLAAVRALAGIRQSEIGPLMRPYLDDRDPRVAITAATALADSPDPADVDRAEAALRSVVEDTRQATAAGRREVAAAIAQIKNPRFRNVLIPLFYDADHTVALEAIRGARKLGHTDALFVPPLVSLLRNRLLKQEAREVLVSYGDEIIDVLAYFLKDREEDVWVRRHIPSTLARLPGQKSMDLLVEVLDDPDGFLRYKAVTAIEKLHREQPSLTIARKPIEDLALKQCLQYFGNLSLRFNLFGTGASDQLLARALAEKLQRTRDRVFRLLGLIYPWKDIAAVRWTLDHGDSRSRASALEYLDNLLTGALRKHVMPVLEDMPLEERVRRGNVFVRSRPRDAEETLAQLIHDDDQILAACAIHYVEEKRLWKLADDLEHALEHRDVKDWYVFEAASWALAAYRLPAEKRRALWMEPLPAVELANRLRKIPLFDYQSVDELFRIASLGRQVRHENARVLYQQGTTADQLQFLLDGKVTVTGSGGQMQEIEAPAALAFEEVLEGSPARTTMRAVDGAICLALGADEFLTLLSNNSLLAQGLFGMLLSDASSKGWQTVIPSEQPAEIARLATGGLTPIEKVLALQEVPLFSRTAADDLLAIAAIARQIDLTVGAALFAESDRPAIYTLLSGELSLEQAGASPAVADTGDTIGVVETLGSESAGGKATVARAGVALRIDRDDLFDLLGDRVGALQSLFSAVLRIEKSEPVPAS